MKKFFVIFVFFISQIIFAQVQFEAKVSRNTLPMNERLRVDFVMNVDGDNFNQPSFEGFRVVAGPSQQVSQSWINGRSSFEKIYSYFLLPQQKGTLTIKQASIEFNGQVYKTSPIKITVTNATEQPKEAGEQSQVASDSNLYLIAEVSKENPYINEPITVIYKLYFSNINITNFRELNKPTYNNFWSQNIEIKELIPEEVMFKGQNYHFVVLKKVILYPQKAGVLNIEPLSLEVDAQVPTSRRDIFGRPFVIETTKKVSAGARKIAVKALPETGKPVLFTGAVGKFDFRVVPNKTTLKNGESLDLTVSVAGKGNLKLFALPKPEVPNALEMYDPVHKEEVNTPLSGMTGKISDKYTIVPQFKGNYPIKSMAFSYFDLDSGTYKVITSPEIMINVLDGPMAGTAAEAKAESQTTKTPINLLQFKFIKLNTNLENANQTDFLGSKRFYTLLLLPFLLIPIIVLLKNKNEASKVDFVGNRIKMNNKLAKKYLSEAKKQLGNKESFYIALERAMHNFLKAKLYIETSEMSKDNISELLISKKANLETVSDFINLTENCELARYAPSSSTAIQQDYDKAVQIISELEKQMV